MDQRITRTYQESINDESDLKGITRVISKCPQYSYQGNDNVFCVCESNDKKNCKCNNQEKTPEYFKFFKNPLER